jgi:hypothetical protein
MPVSELEKKPDKNMSATSTESKRPSGASFKSGVNPVKGESRYLEEKLQPGQGNFHILAASI